VLTTPESYRQDRIPPIKEYIMKLAMRRRLGFQTGGIAAVLCLVVLASCAEMGEELLTSPQTGAESLASMDLGPQDFGPAIRAAERYTPALMQRSGVVGTGVGINEEGRPSVRIFLAHDQVRNLPDRLDDVPVSAVVTGIFRPRVDRTVRARPAPIGFSVGHPDITAGTLGARVKNRSGQVFILSNNHVLAKSNDAKIGDSALQPGSFDGGSDPADAIGTLSAYYEINFDGGANTMDAAIALVDGANVSGSTPDQEGYGSPSTSPTDPQVNMVVQKYGRTTGHTSGTVGEINVTVTVCYSGFIFCTKSATFVGQFTITPGSFSDGGDSGSLIVTQNGNHPVGLLFAGSSTRTIANPIKVVLDHFGVAIDPTVPDGDGVPTDPDFPGEGDLAIDEFNVSTRSSGPWRRADVSWAVSHTGGGLASVTTDLLSEGVVVASQTSSESGSSASGEHSLRTRSGTPDKVRLTVTDVDGKLLVKESPVVF
jgi:hypothetical protein